MNDYYLLFVILVIGFVVSWQINRAWKNIDADSYFRRSFDYINNENYDKAIEKLSKAIRFNPKHLNAYNNRGGMWGKKGDYDKAIADYSEAIRMNPNENWAYYNRGCSYYYIDKYEKAITDLTEAIRIDPNDKDAYNCRGCSYRTTNEHDNAIIDFTEAIRLDPKNIFAYNCRGCSYRAINEHDNAIIDFTESIHLDPKEIFAYNNRAWLYATSPVINYRNGKQSIKDATKACELSNWNVSECIGTLAAAFAESGDFENAIKWIKKAISMDDDFKDIRLEMLSLFEQNKPYRNSAAK